MLKGVFHRGIVFQVCLLIEPDSCEWGLSAKSADLK